MNLHDRWKTLVEIKKDLFSSSHGINSLLNRRSLVSFLFSLLPSSSSISPTGCCPFSWRSRANRARTNLKNVNPPAVEDRGSASSGLSSFFRKNKRTRVRPPLKFMAAFHRYYHKILDRLCVYRRDIGGWLALCNRGNKGMGGSRVRAKYTAEEGVTFLLI